MNMVRPIAILAGFVLALFNLAAQEDHGFTTVEIERAGQAFMTNCARCHGPDGDGIPGIDLASGRFRNAATDQDVIRIIRNGIPGTPMPPSSLSDQQAGAIAAYLRAMGNASSGRTSAAAGDPARGKSLFEGKGQCLTCHRASGNGAFLGPDLSEIGMLRRRADLERSLLDPSAEIRQDNQTVRVAKRDGKTVNGRLLNQDTYTLQIIDAEGKLLTINKEGLREFEIMKKSAMPEYNSRLAAQELSDVVGYLTALKGQPQ